MKAAWQTLFERGHATWPQITIDPARFEAHLARLQASDALEVDLYLACACAAGDPAALAVFDATHLSGVGAFIVRIDSSSTFADEVRQQLREKLLVATPGQPPRIAAYAGRGPLGGWVRAAAVRTAINLARRRTDDPLSSELEQPGLAAIDPEAALLKERYREAYEQAMRAAFAGLSAKERNLLRMCFVDGMNVDQIGVAYRVHRATAARWVQAARERLVMDVHDALREKLQLTAAELDSLTGVVRSQLHLSLTGLLRQD